ncbi:phosphonate C-P lyase system protein PhnG [Bartonella sp. LJL80]
MSQHIGTEEKELPKSFPHDLALTILARAESGAIKHLAEKLLDKLGDVEVMENRTGLVMAPMRDTVKGSQFHLGEVLVAEARIFSPLSATEGYGMVVGRDLEHAMAMAIIDAAYQAEEEADLLADFLKSQHEKQQLQDNERLCDVNATRVEMETF